MDIDLYVYVHISQYYTNVQPNLRTSVFWFLFHTKLPTSDYLVVLHVPVHGVIMTLMRTT